jgi:hypothetical protein
VLTKHDQNGFMVSKYHTFFIKNGIYLHIWLGNLDRLMVEH